MNFDFLRDFSLDLAFILEFVSKLEGGHLKDHFEELQQIIDLFLSDSFNDFLNPVVKSKKYPRVSQEVAKKVALK